MWGRLSPHPAFERERGRDRAPRVRPTRVAPLAIFLREDADWLLATPQPSPEDSLSHPAREVLDVLETRGASFFADLARATGRLASEVEDALWELVAAGLVTADGFENLRALLDPKRRRGEGRGRTRASPARRRPLGAAAPRGRAAATDIGRDASRASCCSAGAWCSATAAARETLAPPWRDLLVVLRRMEARGEIRGGRFVAGFHRRAVRAARRRSICCGRSGGPARPRGAPDLAQSLVPSASALLPIPA